MKSRIVALAAGIVALLLVSVALAPGVFAQTRGAGNGQVARQGNASGTPGMMQGRMGGMGMGMMGGQQSSLISVAADKIGMSVEDLVTALGTTKSIAQVATEHNVQASIIVDAFVAARAQNLAAAVQNGRMTQAQADQMLATMRTHVTEEVNEVWTARGPGNGTGFMDSDNDGTCDHMPEGPVPSGNQGGMMNGRTGRGGPNR
ncbi:MAG: hypothetical protein ABI670_11360 [Chloroflexota bacterium]